MMNEEHQLKQLELINTFGDRRPSCADAAKEAQRAEMRAMTPRERVFLALRLGREGARLAALDKRR
jgi:hypothetical protein